MNNSKTYKILWQASIPRALMEGTALGAAVFFVLLISLADGSAMVYGQTMFFLAPLVTLLYSLRAPLSEKRFWPALGHEAIVILGFVPGVMLGLSALAWSLGFWPALSTNPQEWLNIAFMAFVCGSVLSIARVTAYLWRWWGNLRRRKMLWSLTHTYLQAVLIIAVPMLLFFILALTLSTGFNFTSLDTWIYTILPATGVAVAGTVIMLGVILPVGAFVAWLTVRKTTDRVQNLASVMQDLREGDYDARVTVDGEDEIGQMQDDFNAMADELQGALVNLEAERDKVSQVLDSNRNLVASVSHELRTPVATIRGYLDAIDRTELENVESVVLRHDLDIIDHEISRLQALIDDLFTLSRADVDKLTLNLSPVDLLEVAKERVTVFAPLSWQRERIQISVELDSETAMVLCDKTRVEQILTNLLRNAIRHTPPGGIVVIRINKLNPDSMIRLEVCDTGDGIASEDLPHIWERFYRGANAKSLDARGAGLGLALVRELTEAMHGAVDVQSKLAQGTCFIIDLPKATPSVSPQRAGKTGS